MKRVFTRGDKVKISEEEKRISVPAVHGILTITDTYVYKVEGADECVWMAYYNGSDGKRYGCHQKHLILVQEDKPMIQRVDHKPIEIKIRFPDEPEPLWTIGGRLIAAENYPMEKEQQGELTMLLTIKVDSTKVPADVFREWFARKA